MERRARYDAAHERQRLGDRLAGGRIEDPDHALLWMVWWAIKDPPVPEPEDGGGGSPDRDPRTHPRQRPPQPPRRGPHGPPEPRAPQRSGSASRTPRRTLR